MNITLLRHKKITLGCNLIPTSLLHDSDQFITGCKYVVNWLTNIMRCLRSEVGKNIIVSHYDANIKLTSKTSCKEVCICWLKLPSFFINYFQKCSNDYLIY